MSIPDSLLSEDSSSGNVIVEEEEGVVSDPGTEILPETDDKVKVNNLTIDTIAYRTRLEALNFPVPLLAVSIDSAVCRVQGICSWF